MSREMKVYFNNLAPDWKNNPHEFDIREKLVAMSEPNPGSVIADIGCGKGVMLPHLLKTKPAQLIAVDISDEMIKLAKEQNNDPRIIYINDDVLNVSLPPLDTTFIFNAYPHLLNKEALTEKLTKAVKQNGRIIIAHSCSRKKINEIHRKCCSALSASLESAETEARRFHSNFITESIIDNDDFYFIKLRRI